MKRFVFDIEANGFLKTVTKVWCIVIKDIDTKERWSFEPHQIKSALRKLDEADELYGHFIYGYDLPVIEKLHSWIPKCRTVDTVVWSRLAHSDIEREDYNHPERHTLEEQKALGSHSLKSWGIRLGCHKGEFGAQQDAFETYSIEMLLYCCQDVDVNDALIEHLVKQDVPLEALDMELAFARYTEQMTRHGFAFDRKTAEELCSVIEKKRDELGTVLRSTFQPEIITGSQPRFWRAFWPDGSETRHETKGAAESERKRLKLKPAQVRLKKGPPKKKLVEFNPNSRDQVREALYERYGWLSPVLSEGGQKAMAASNGTHDEYARQYGSINEDTLEGCDAPEAKLFIGYMMCAKRLGQIRDGDNGWLKLLEDDGRIRHKNVSIGCATMRNAHWGPNVAQTPAVVIGRDKKPLMGFEGGWGYECRACWIPSSGYVQVGTDLAGIEARMLAHYLQPFDGGAYIDQVLNGDIHSLNVDAIKKLSGFIVGRNDFKPGFYGYLYGAGNSKLGLLLCSICEEAQREYVQRYGFWRTREFEIWDGTTRKKKRVHGAQFPFEASQKAYSEFGQQVRESLEIGITGLGDLVKKVKEAANSGCLRPLDRRRIPIRSSHAALNTLLQGSAAVVMKRWVIGCFDEVARRKIDAHLLAVIHDETQSEVRADHVPEYIEVCIGAIRDAGKHYRLKIPLDGEAKVGTNWAGTH